VIGDGPAAEEALKLLNEAKDALMDGNLGRYQELVDGARGVLVAAATAEAAEKDAAASDDADTAEVDTDAEDTDG